MIHPWKQTSDKQTAEEISGVLFPDIKADALPSGMTLETWFAMPGIIEARYRNGTDNWSSAGQAGIPNGFPVTTTLTPLHLNTLPDHSSLHAAARMIPSIPRSSACSAAVPASS